jgi:Bacterial SH3 domain
MRANTPEPRLPLEPEEYPLYTPPRRIGCSALAVLPIILVLVFGFLFLRVTPQMAQAIMNIPRGLLNIPTPEPEVAPGAGALATQTVELPTATPAATDTPVPAPTDTPVAEEYVKVANTGGSGVRLRAEAKTDSARVDGLAEGTILKIIGPDEKNNEGTWRHVQVLNGDQQGWILSKWLAPAAKP